MLCAAKFSRVFRELVVYILLEFAALKAISLSSSQYFLIKDLICLSMYTHKLINVFLFLGLIRS